MRPGRCLRTARRRLPAQPLTMDECPFPPGMREMYYHMQPEVRAACDPILIEHRDRIFARHISLPMEF